ncbi:unnamed protein product [Auanema sp. JU1783]|nr:unnamed protein product [Auanema sp. JU1783]
MIAWILISLVASSIAADATTTTTTTSTTQETKNTAKDAHILASKFPLSMYAVENMDLVIEYEIHNVGAKAATNVVLDDRHSFPTQSFEIVKGLLQVRFEDIAPRSKAVHSVVLKPRQYGIFNYTSAQVTYNTQGETDVHVGLTNAPGEGYIYRLKEYERKFSIKYPYWIVFAILISPFTVGSLIFYYNSKTKYEELAKKKL